MTIVVFVENISFSQILQRWIDAVLTLIVTHSCSILGSMINIHPRLHIALRPECFKVFFSWFLIAEYPFLTSNSSLCTHLIVVKRASLVETIVNRLLTLVQIFDKIGWMVWCSCNWWSTIKLIWILVVHLYCSYSLCILNSWNCLQVPMTAFWCQYFAANMFSRWVNLHQRW